MTDKISQINDINIRIPEVRGVIRKNFELSRLSWLKVGGPAEIFFQPEDEDDLSFFLKKLETSIPIFVIGAIGTFSMVLIWGWRTIFLFGYAWACFQCRHSVSLTL